MSELNMNLEKALELMEKKQFYENGWEWHRFSVIEPLDYSMDEGIMLYGNFGFIFTSNSEKWRDIVELDCMTLTQQLHNISTTIVDVDGWSKYLMDFGNAPLKDVAKLLEIYVFLTEINSSGHIYYYKYSYLSDIRHYRFYCGTLKLSADEIQQKAIEAIDVFNGSRTFKKKFVPFFTNKI